MTDKDMSLLCATWVMAWATIAAAIAAIVSAFFARKAVSDQAKNFSQQIADYRLALSADTALKFDASFNDPKFEKIRSKAAHALLAKQNEGEAEDVFDFFDSVGLFVRLGALKEEIAYAVFFHWINLYWRAGKNHIGAKQKDTASVWKDFELLYHQVSEIEKQKHADSEDLKMTEDRLHSQLQDEVGLV